MNSIKQGITIACLATFFLASGLAPIAATINSTRDGNRVLVIVNRDTIRYRDLNKLIIEFHTKMSNDKKSDFDYEKLLNKNVNDLLIIQEARAQGWPRLPVRGASGRRC